MLEHVPVLVRPGPRARLGSGAAIRWSRPGSGEPRRTVAGFVPPCRRSNKVAGQEQNGHDSGTSGGEGLKMTFRKVGKNSGTGNAQTFPD